MEGARSWRDAAAAELLVKHLDRLAPAGPALVLSDPVDVVASALAGRGLEVRRWWRRAVGGRDASPWPPAGPWETAALRLPRAKEELEMAVHAAAGVLGRSGRLLVYGAGDEGIKSAPGRISGAFGAVASVATGGRCRVLEARDPRPGARSGLEAWAGAFDPGIEALPASWVSYPGVFAHGRVDGGTRLLLEHLPVFGKGERVLDFGCGHGIVGAAVAARDPGVRVEFLDVDAVALEAVRANVPGSVRRLGDGWFGVPAEARYDGVVANPPYHAGKGESMGVVEALVAGAAERLPAGGRLALVAQRRLPVGPRLEKAFGEVAVRGDRGPWRVWWAGRPKSGTATG